MTASKGAWWSFLGNALSQSRKGHRPFGEAEARLLRRVTRTTEAAAVPAEHNPGVRVEEAFITAEEAKDMARAARDIVSLYGISHLSGQQRAFLAGQMRHLKGLPEDGSYVNMKRVTGRWESEEQQLAPWGHGPTFDLENVPGPLRLALERIRDSTSFHLGSPTDITINYRHSTFYRLDPHVDPSKDGGNIFILGLLSPTVLSLSPCLPSMHPQQFLHMDQRKVSEQGWIPGKDLDVKLQARSLLHLSGDARYKWNHGIRVGVAASQLEQYGVDVVDDDSDDGGGDKEAEEPIIEGDVKSVRLYDWFGSIKSPVRRGRERMSIIFAFNDP